ncbi:MAG: ester cyclase [Candidatus Bathyarchaeota archaeon]|nr:MAG: ester cyclase [Candidatus Bathyarchaeota archaeon]
MNDRDLSIVPKLVTPGFVRHDLAGAFREVGGREGVTDFLQLLLKTLPDLRSNIEDIFGTGDRVALRITLVGTHKGGFQGIAATGKKVKFSGSNIYRFEDGKIAEAWQLYDVAGFLRQTGALTT